MRDESKNVSEDFEKKKKEKNPAAAKDGGLEATSKLLFFRDRRDFSAVCFSTSSNVVELHS